MTALTYDTSALVAAEKGDRTMWAIHRAALRKGLVPNVPAAVLAEAWRGGPQPDMSRLLAGCAVQPLLEGPARRVGALAAKAGHDDVVDVSVVECALCRGDAVVTSDPRHIRAIATAARAHLVIHPV